MPIWQGDRKYLCRNIKTMVAIVIYYLLGAYFLYIFSLYCIKDFLPDCSIVWAWRSVLNLKLLFFVGRLCLSNGVTFLGLKFYIDSCLGSLKTQVWRLSMVVPHLLLDIYPSTKAYLPVCSFWWFFFLTDTQQILPFCVETMKADN